MELSFQKAKNEENKFNFWIIDNFLWKALMKIRSHWIINGFVASMNFIERLIWLLWYV